MAQIGPDVTSPFGVKPKFNTLAEQQEQQGVVVSDYGAAEAVKSSFTSGLKWTSLGMGASLITQYNLRGDGSDPITEDSYWESDAWKYGVSFKEGDTESSLAYKVDQARKRTFADSKIYARKRGLVTMPAGIAGSLPDPVNFLGIGWAGASAKAAALAGKRSAAFFHGTKDSFLAMQAYNAVTLPAYAAAQEQATGIPYSADQGILDVGFNTIFGAGFSLFGGRKNLKNATYARNTEMGYNNMERAMNDHDIVGVARSTFESGSENINRIVTSDQRLQDIVDGKIKAEELNVEDKTKISVLAQVFEKEASVARVQKSLAEKYRNGEYGGSKDPLVTASSKFKKQLNRVTETLVDGDLSRLSKDDIEVMESAGFVFESENGALYSKGSRVISENAANTIVEDIGLLTKTDYNLTNQNVRDLNTISRNLVEIGKMDGQKVKDPKRRSELLDDTYVVLNRVYEAAYGKKYTDLVDEVATAVNEILTGQKDFIKTKVNSVDDQLVDLVLEKKGSSERAASYAYIEPHMRELTTYVNGPHHIFGGFSSGATASKHGPTILLSTLMHEAWHNLAKFDSKTYNKLLRTAKSLDLTSPTNKVILSRGGYSESELKYETNSVLLEAAMALPEFWAALPKATQAKYSNVINAVLNLSSKYGDQIPSFRELSPKLSATEYPKILAENIANIHKNIENKSISNGVESLKVNQERVGDALYKRPEYEPSYENKNFNSRANQQDLYEKDPYAYMVKTIGDLLGPNKLTPYLTFRQPQSKADFNARVVELITELDESGHTHVAKYAKDIITSLSATDKRRTKVLKQLRKGQGNTVTLLSEMFDSGTPTEAIYRIGYILEDSTMNPSQKLTAVNKFFEQENAAMMLRKVHDANIEKTIDDILASKSSPKAKLDQLKTFLDGSQRQGSFRGQSVQRAVDVQIQKDQTPLIEFLENNGMLELFLGEDVSKYMGSYRTKVHNLKSYKKIYGDNLKEASKKLHIDIMNAISTGKTPKRLKGNKEFEELVDIIKTTLSGQMAEINHLGVNMRRRQGFNGYGVAYDRTGISQMSKAEFVDYMLRVSDLEKTHQLHGGVMKGLTNVDEKGTVKKIALVDFEPKKYFENFYDEVVSGKFDEGLVEGDSSILGGLRKSAKIAYKQEFEIEAAHKLSNFESMGRMLLRQIRNRSEKISLVKQLGHDPNAQLLSYAKTKGLEGQSGYKTFKMTADQITGKLDNPADAHIAKIFQTIRQASNVLFLPTSGLSALSDIPLTISTLQYLGAKMSTGEFIQAYKSAAANHFKGNKTQTANWFRAQGAGFDLVTRTMAQRVVTGESFDNGITGFANQAMFEINGLNRITAVHQQIFIDILTNSLGQQFKSGKFNDTLIGRMKEFGFTDVELKTLRKYVVKTPDGKLRLGSSNIENAPLQRKMSNFLMTYMKEAVIEPDAGAQAIARLGLESGTITGEVARTALQYSSFMLGMSRVVYRRFANGYNNDAPYNASRMSHLATYIGAALAFAYMTTVLKDLSRFKEPINAFNMSNFDMMRILRQSGLFGITELGLNAAQFGPSAALSPMGEMAVNVASGDFKSAAKPFSGKQYPVVGPVINSTFQQIIGAIHDETVVNTYEPMLDRLK